MENRHFPVFIPTKGKKFVVFGGGNIAQRRVKTLLDFDFDVVIVSPRITEELTILADCGRIQYIHDRYKESFLEGAYLVTACTNDREVNRQIGMDAKAAGIPVSVCDKREECTFYFPAIAANDEVTLGICGSGKSHAVTRKAAAKVREIVKRKAYE